jgi:flagellar basal body-associated protein FliL
MAKIFARFFFLLVAFSAYAQAAAEAPVDKASPVTVIIFLLLFVGSCAGYFVYLWWSQKKVRAAGQGEKKS